MASAHDCAQDTSVVRRREFCYVQGIVNRDIKLENTLLDGTKRPLLKICDFGYSKHEKDSLPKSKVGTPGYTGEIAQSHQLLPLPSLACIPTA